MQHFFDEQWNRDPRENLMERAVQFAVDRLVALSKSVLIDLFGIPSSLNPGWLANTVTVSSRSGGS